MSLQELAQLAPLSRCHVLDCWLRPLVPIFSNGYIWLLRVSEEGDVYAKSTVLFSQSAEEEEEKLRSPKEAGVNIVFVHSNH